MRDTLFIPVGWYNFEQGTARAVTGLVVVDVKTDSVVSYTETDRCAGATELAFDDHGDVYFGTNRRCVLAQELAARVVARAGSVARAAVRSSIGLGAGWGRIVAAAERCDDTQRTQRACQP